MPSEVFPWGLHVNVLCLEQNESKAELIMYENGIPDSYILLFLLSSANNIYAQHHTGKYISFDHHSISDLSDKYYINRYFFLLSAQFETFKQILPLNQTNLSNIILLCFMRWNLHCCIRLLHQKENKDFGQPFTEDVCHSLIESHMCRCGSRDKKICTTDVVRLMISNDH